MTQSPAPTPADRPADTTAAAQSGDALTDDDHKTLRSAAMLASALVSRAEKGMLEQPQGIVRGVQGDRRVTSPDRGPRRQGWLPRAAQGLAGGGRGTHPRTAGGGGGAPACQGPRSRRRLPRDGGAELPRRRGRGRRHLGQRAGGHREGRGGAGLTAIAAASRCARRLSARRSGAGRVVEDAGETLAVEGVQGQAVPPGHRLGLQHRVEDRLGGGLDDGGEERVEELEGEHLHLQLDRGARPGPMSGMP